MVTSSMGNIATVGTPDKYMEGTQGGNARLIAAAPDMLAACEAMVLAAQMRDPALGGVAATLAAAAIAEVMVA
jgi:hypothetical protein